MKPQVGQIWKRHGIDYLISITAIDHDRVYFDYYPTEYVTYNCKIEDFPEMFSIVTPLEQLL